MLIGCTQDPSNADAFSYLGHYSLRVERDVAKATRCYLKSLSLDAANREAGPVLADLYLCHEQSEESAKVCEAATAANQRADWAWIRLGRHYRSLYHHMQQSGSANAALTHGTPNSLLRRSVTAYQNALRSRPHDPACWEELAQAYNGFGQFMAALKSLTHAIQLDPDSAEADVRRYQLASTELSLGMADEAIGLLSQLSRLPNELRSQLPADAAAAAISGAPAISIPAAYGHSGPTTTLPAGADSKSDSKTRSELAKSSAEAKESLPAALTTAPTIEISEPEAVRPIRRKPASAGTGTGTGSGTGSGSGGDDTSKPRAAFFPAIKLLADALYSRARLQFTDGAYAAAHQTIHACLWTLRAGFDILRTSAVTASASTAGAWSSASADVWSSSDLSSLPAGLIPLALAPSLRSTNTVSMHKLYGDAYALLSQFPAPVLPPTDRPLAPDADADADAVAGVAGVAGVARNFLSATVNVDARHTCLVRADRAYAKAIHIAPSSTAGAALIWYDRAVIGLRGFHVWQSADRTAETAQWWQTRAISCIKSAIALDPHNASFWNVLGVVYPSDRPEIRQHCFIQALKIASAAAGGGAATADSWINIGSLYMSIGERELTRDCFERAQSADPQKPVRSS